MFNIKLSWPVFSIKPQDSQGKGSSQKTSKETTEKLVVSKNVVLAHVHNLINEVIAMIYDTKAANVSMRK
jgi:hypothetical protein